MKNENEIMILIKEKKKGEVRLIRERREIRKSGIKKVSLWLIYSHTLFLDEIRGRLLSQDFDQNIECSGSLESDIQNIEAPRIDDPII